MLSEGSKMLFLFYWFKINIMANCIYSPKCSTETLEWIKITRNVWPDRVRIYFPISCLNDISVLLIHILLYTLLCIATEECVIATSVVKFLFLRNHFGKMDCFNCWMDCFVFTLNTIEPIKLWQLFHHLQFTVLVLVLVNSMPFPYSLNIVVKSLIYYWCRTLIECFLF